MILKKKKKKKNQTIQEWMIKFKFQQTFVMNIIDSHTK